MRMYYYNNIIDVEKHATYSLLHDKQLSTALLVSIGTYYIPTIYQVLIKLYIILYYYTYKTIEQLNRVVGKLYILFYDSPGSQPVIACTYSQRTYSAIDNRSCSDANIYGFR